MDNDAQRTKQDQLEEHSLPGTNQAGTSTSSPVRDDQENPPSEEVQRQEQLEEHSLPGTNQAGTGRTNPTTGRYRTRST